jgi:eukaryotic-like serine/threonine-protein kinase
MRLVSIMLLSAGILNAAEEWSQFRGNPQLTGVVTGSVPGNLRLIWTYNADESIESSAAIAGVTVYVGSRSKDLLAIELKSGKVKWKYRAADSIGESSRAVSGGIVSIGDLGGELHAVNAADGKGRWTFKTEGEIKSSPAVSGDRILIASYDANPYCLSHRDGRLLWKVTTGNYVHSTPAISDDVPYFSGCDETVYGIRLADGQEVVTFPSGGYTGASMVLVEKRGYYGTFNNEVVGVDLVKQSILWRYKSSRFSFYSSAAFGGDRIIIGGRDKLVHAIDITSGKANWTFRTRARVDSSPAIASGCVYVGSNNGTSMCWTWRAGKNSGSMMRVLPCPRLRLLPGGEL